MWPTHDGVLLQYTAIYEPPPCSTCWWHISVKVHSMWQGQRDACSTVLSDCMIYCKLCKRQAQMSAPKLLRPRGSASLLLGPLLYSRAGATVIPRTQPAASPTTPHISLLQHMCQNRYSNAASQLASDADHHAAHRAQHALCNSQGASQLTACPLLQPSTLKFEPRL